MLKLYALIAALFCCPAIFGQYVAAGFNVGATSSTPTIGPSACTPPACGASNVITGSNPNSIAISSFNTPTGVTMFCVVGYNGGPTSGTGVTMADTASNFYVQIGFDSGGNGRQATFRSFTTAASGTNTITASLGSTVTNVLGISCTYANHLTNALDANPATVNGGFGTTGTGPSITTSHNVEVIFAGSSGDRALTSTCAVTAPAGYTVYQSDADWVTCIAARITTTTASGEAASWSLPGGAFWALDAASFY